VQAVVNPLRLPAVEDETGRPQRRQMPRDLGLDFALGWISPRAWVISQTQTSSSATISIRQRSRVVSAKARKKR